MIPDTASLWATAKRLEGVLRKDAQAYSFAPLADIYLRLGLPEDALDLARKGCALHPDFAAGQMALAKAALACNLTSEAKNAFEAVVRVTPENLEAQKQLSGLHAAAGDDAAARRCLAIIESLDIELQHPVAAETSLLESDLYDEIPDDDILELSDDLIEEYSDDDVPDFFAASPERPSLGTEQNRAEPFLLETAPPVCPDAPEKEDSVPSMVSATIAELYVSQGFTDRGSDVYRELLAADPLNTTYRRRLDDLTQVAAQPETSAPDTVLNSVTAKLYEWLGNIGRVKECRSRNL